MQGLVISLPLDVMKSKDEVLKPSDLNPILDVIQKLIIPHASTMKIFNTFESMGIQLQNKTGS